MTRHACLCDDRGGARAAASLVPPSGGHPATGRSAAALALAGLLAHLLLAQLTLLLAVAADLAGRASRWRPLWLGAPAAAGFVWVLAIGPGRALAGFTAGPHQVLGYLAGGHGQPTRVLHPARASAGIGRWLPRQAPLALMLAPAEAAMAWWLRWRRAGPQGLPPPRPGLIAAARRQLTVAWVRSGGVVSRTGACLGADWQTGRPAGISWRAAEGGVLVTGAVPADLSAASFQLVHAAIRRRKPVLVVEPPRPRGAARGARRDLRGRRRAAARVRGRPGLLRPVARRRPGPAHAGGLVMGMIDWDPVTDLARRTCAAYLNDLFAVAAAAPGDPRLPVLDDVAALLSPAALRARPRRFPRITPGAGRWASGSGSRAGLLEADPATATFLAGGADRAARVAAGPLAAPRPRPARRRSAWPRWSASGRSRSSRWTGRGTAAPRR